MKGSKYGRKEGRGACGERTGPNDRHYERVPGVKALDNVKLDLYAGEVLALLGENGAGKSTLMKILSGVYQRDDGEIILFGNKIGEWDANKAKNAGVSIIHQELNMCTHLSVAENIFLGRELIKNGRLDNERMNQEQKRSFIS